MVLDVSGIAASAWRGGRVSSYVAAALEDFAERESLKEVLAGWNAESPVPDEIRQQVQGELDRIGLAGGAGRDDRLAG